MSVYLIIDWAIQETNNKKYKPCIYFRCLINKATLRVSQTSRAIWLPEQMKKQGKACEFYLKRTFWTCSYPLLTAEMTYIDILDKSQYQSRGHNLCKAEDGEALCRSAKTRQEIDCGSDHELYVLHSRNEMKSRKTPNHWNMTYINPLGLHTRSDTDRFRKVRFDRQNAKNYGVGCDIVQE